MELVVVSQTETYQLASDGPEPATESPTTEGMAKTELTNPQAILAGHLTKVVCHWRLRMRVNASWQDR